MNLLMQTGSFPDHCPLNRHLLTLFMRALTLKPSLQEYLAFEPAINPFTLTLPFTGFANSGQFTAPKV